MSDCPNCENGQPCAHGAPSARPTLDTRGRVPVEPQQGPMVGATRSFDRHYDVQAFTGYASSTVPGGQWARGRLVRMFQPVLQPARIPPMYDPTDPRTWPQAGTWEPN